MKLLGLINQFNRVGSPNSNKWQAFLRLFCVSQIKTITASLLILLSLTAAAHEQCRELFSVFTWKRYHQESNSLFTKALHGDESKGEKELAFYWHTSNPSILKREDDNTFKYAYSNKSRTIYSNHPDKDAETPLQSVSTLFGRPDITNAEILREFIKNYEGKVPEEIIQEIEYIESEIGRTSDDRQSFGYVATALAEFGGKILGTYRVFNGTRAHSTTDPRLPSERSFSFRKLKTKTAAYLKHLRRKKPNLPIFELGKFSNIGDATVQERVRSLIELFWLRYFIDNAPPDAIFVAHVDSKAHVRRYQSRYGFKIFEQIITDGKETNEFVLMATAAELREAFSKLYPIVKPDVTIL